MTVRKLAALAGVATLVAAGPAAADSGSWHRGDHRGTKHHCSDERGDHGDRHGDRGWFQGDRWDRHGDFGLLFGHRGHHQCGHHDRGDDHGGSSDD